MNQEYEPGEFVDVSIVTGRPGRTDGKNTDRSANLVLPDVLSKLPVGQVLPLGWLKECVERLRTGLAGHLGQISAWLQKSNNAWLDPLGTGEFGWEEVPYWLKGYAHIGYLTGDPKILQEVGVWFDRVLEYQRDDGDFGPIHYEEGGEKRDYWGNMIMLTCLSSWYEYTGDARVIPFFQRYFKYQLNCSDGELLAGYWQRLRGGDNLKSVIWLYRLTGENWLVDLAEKIHRVTADWTRRDYDLSEIRGVKASRDGSFPQWFFSLPDWHNVNIAQGFREPAQYYQVSRDRKHLAASYEVFEIVHSHFGGVPGGMFAGDENCRVGYSDPRQAVETCGIVEQMNSDQHMFRITGDPKWADHCEEVALNSLPATMMPDFRSLRYLTAPNLVTGDSRNHHPGIANDGPFLLMNPFSSRCCQHNHAQGWTYLAENSWMRTDDDGYCMAFPFPCEVNTTDGSGHPLRIEVETRYPFEETVQIRVHSTASSSIPLYLRVPDWCSEAKVSVNGYQVKVKALPGAYLRLVRTWVTGDLVTLTLPMSLRWVQFERLGPAASLYYGPTAFSLGIRQEVLERNSIETAIFDSKWQASVDGSAWPSYELLPASAWNFGLPVSAQSELGKMVLRRRPWPKDNFPFEFGSTPLTLQLEGVRLPTWTLDEYGLCGELSSIDREQLGVLEELELIPMGAARLRVSVFPVVGGSNEQDSF
ncbi:MAG: beta-L-arabinofuranosidase domain-containing protein [Spirochaetales bacterium]